MALTAQQIAQLDLYIDEVQPNTAGRAALRASDDLVSSTLTTWLPIAIGRRNGVISTQNSVIADAQNIIANAQSYIAQLQNELNVLTAIN